MTAETLPWELPVEARADGRIDLLALDLPALESLVLSLGERPFRAKQIFSWLHQRLASSFDEMTDLKLDFRRKLAALADVRAPVVADVKQAADGTRKYRLLTFDGHSIEAVFIPHASGPNKNALCISSQVGCAMGCAFCATASLKLARHLSPGEIVGQLYAVVRDLRANADNLHLPLPARFDRDLTADDTVDEDGQLPADSAKPGRWIQNVVYMGMGEPLHNVDGVIASIRLLTHQQGQGMSSRRLTVSTSGLVPAIARLGVETDVHLAVSLNATTDEVRRVIMPVDKRWGIEELLGACLAFPLKSRRRITFEYVLLADVNDSDDDAHRLVRLMHNQRAKVNLIPYNPHPLSSFQRPSGNRVERFRKILESGHVSCFVRTTRGDDIDAACGMLGAIKLEEARASSRLPVLSN